MKLLRTTLVIGSLAVLPACSAHSSGGGPGLSDPDASSGTPPTSACSELCPRIIAAPGCSFDMASCVSQCSMSLGGLPSSCNAAVSAFTACARTSPITCSMSGPTFTSCASETIALAACGSSTPRTDAGSSPDASGGGSCSSATTCAQCTAGSSCGWCNGRCYAGTGSGPTPPATCGGDSWAWLSSDCPM